MYNAFTFLQILSHNYIRRYNLLQTTSTGEHGALIHDVAVLRSEHICPAGHPPLSRKHDGSQYDRPVGSSTLHCDPIGQLRLSQAVRLKHNITTLFN